MDLTLSENKSSVLIGWGVKNDFDYEVRVKEACVLYEGQLFEDQKIGNPKVLRGGAGAEPNFVEHTWEIDALNSAMLTYNNTLAAEKYLVFDFWNQKPLGILSGNENLSRELDQGEALIYSVKKLENHPQIIGTNRHVMCGMFEIKNEKWEEQARTLKFNADIIEGETMKIIVHLPEGKKMAVKKVVANNAKSSFSIEGDYLTITLLNKSKNVNTEVVVTF